MRQLVIKVLNSTCCKMWNPVCSDSAEHSTRLIMYATNTANGCVKLYTERSLSLGPTTGSTPMTKLQITECSLTSSMATQNYYWTGPDKYDFWLFLALTFTSKRKKVSGHHVIALKDILQAEFYKYFHQRQHQQA